MSRLMAALALLSLAVLAGPVQAQQEEGGPAWVTVISDGVDPILPTPGSNPVAAADPRLDLRTLEVADLGSAYGVRLRTAADPADTGVASDVRSATEFQLLTGWLGSHNVLVHAGPDGFQVHTVSDEDWGSDLDGKPLVELDGEAGDFTVQPGSVAWSWEVHIRRDAFGPQGRYLRGDELSYFYAQVWGSFGGTDLSEGWAAQEPWGDRIRLDSSGGLPLDRTAESGLPWYPYNVRVESAGHAMAADGDRLHGVFLVRGEEAYYDREEPGLVHVELVDGELVETVVAEVEGLENRSRTLPVALALHAGEPHILFHPKWSPRSSSADDAVLHAWREGGAWKAEPLGVEVGSIAVDHRSGITLASDGERLVAAVRSADGSGTTLLERGASGWSRLHRFDEVDFVRLALHGGDVHAALYRQDEGAEVGVRSWSSLSYAREGGGWDEVGLASRLADNNEFWHDAQSRGSFGMAIGPDGTPCILVSRHDDRDAVVELGCGLGGDAWTERLRPLEDGGAPLLHVDLAAGPDGDLHATAGYGNAPWYLHRSPEGAYWLEVLDYYEGYEVELLGDGRAVALGNDNGGFGGESLRVRNAEAGDDPRLAFFTGTAEELEAWTGNYRDPPQVAQGGQGAQAAQDSAGAAPREPAVDARPAKEGDRDSPGAGLAAALSALVAVGLALRRRGAA